jgi:RNA polymerase sigma factor (TIGR02999 family)
MTDSSVTGLLHDASRGDRQAFDRLVPLVYDTLRRLAHRALKHERRDHTLSPTALAHEAYVELVGLDRIAWQDRSHFFAMAARAMRRILIDYAVRRSARKRGGGGVAIPLDESVLAQQIDLDALLVVGEALDRLESHAPRAARIVECRVFAGMSIDETAMALDLSAATVKRDWNAARAWLNQELTGGAGNV